MNKFFQPLKKSMAQHLLLPMLIITALVSACTPPTQQKTVSNSPFTIQDGTISLNKHHILSIQTQLFQPSFDIAGVMLPARQANLITPTNGTVLETWVYAGQLVKKGDKLITILPITPYGSPHHFSPMPVVLTAPFDGRIAHINTKKRASTLKHEILMAIVSDNEYQFVGVVPAFLKNDLKIGQPINLQANATLISDNQGDDEQLVNNSVGGQISDIKPQDDKLVITAQIPTPMHIKGFFEKDDRFKTGEPTTGHIVADGLQVGILAPQEALIGDVSQLKKPPYRTALPLLAHSWVIHQDHTIHRTAVSVIEYRPDVKRFLVAGIRDDGLLVVGDLPMAADGLTVVAK